MEHGTSCHHCGLPARARGLLEKGPWFCCFGCRLAHELALPVNEPGSSPLTGTLLLRLGLGIFLAINIMVASWLSYSREWFGAAARASGDYESLVSLFAHFAFFLCTLVVVLLGIPLLSDGIRRWTGPFGRGTIPAGGRFDAQLLIVIGVFSAYTLSAVHVWRGEGSLYFDTAAMVLVIVTLGSYLEAGAKERAASSARRAVATLPAKIWVRRCEELLELDTSTVELGDVVRVQPGEMVPIDGHVVSGLSCLDEASLTGESRPRAAEPGDPVWAGSTSLDGQLWVRAERVGDGTVLALLERSLEEARACQPEVQRLADRVAAVFVPGVVVLALGVCVWRSWHGQLAGGILDGLSVLLISCPCALGLAAPLASWNALRRAAEGGLLIDSAATLERAATVDRLYFDKTGTLSEPVLALTGVTMSSGVDERQAIEQAASLEAASNHPLARALLSWAARQGIRPRAVEMARTVAGLGIEGQLDGWILRLGSVRWARRLGFDVEEKVNEGSTNVLYLMSEEHLLACFELAEKPRAGARESIATLRRLGIEVGILSGDQEGATQRLAALLGIDAEGALLPADKMQRLADARASGRGRPRLAMVGDGLNDAPALAAADVGIALGSAGDLAKSSGNVRLLSDRLETIPLLFAIARDTRRRILLNLAWSFSFNSVGILLAVFGRLTPVFAALAMVLSSLIVVRVSRQAGLAALTAASGKNLAGADVAETSVVPWSPSRLTVEAGG